MQTQPQQPQQPQQPEPKREEGGDELKDIPVTPKAKTSQDKR